MTPLLTAISRDKTRLVELLLAHGAKVDLKSENLLAIEKV
jgi:ankyrin repeat protein